MGHQLPKTALTPPSYGVMSQRQSKLLAIVNSPNYHGPDDETLLDLSSLLEALDIKDFPDCNHKCSGEDRVARAIHEHSRLVEMPLTVERWFDGERDSFGPLSRICRVHCDGDWTTRSFIYCVYG
jgi:hypothetical protein